MLVVDKEGMVSVAELFEVVEKVLSEKYGEGSKVRVVREQSVEGDCKLVTEVLGSNCSGGCASGFSFDCEGWFGLKLEAEVFIECYVEDLLGCMLDGGLVEESGVKVLEYELVSGMLNLLG